MHGNPVLTCDHQCDYGAPRKYVLVLSCVDARLLDDLVRYLNQDNLSNRYYHLTLPGTALGLTDRVEDDIESLPECTPDRQQHQQSIRAMFPRWRQTFIEQVQATVSLPKGLLTDFYIVQHEDCGAYRVYLGKDSAEMTDPEERQLHHEYAHALLDDLRENFCTIYNPVDPISKQPIQEKIPFVHTFYMNLRGQMMHLETWPKWPKHRKQEPCCKHGEAKKPREKKK